MLTLTQYETHSAPSLTNPENANKCHLLKGGAEVSVHDPEAMKNIDAIFGDQITYHDEKYAALKACGAEAARELACL